MVLNMVLKIEAKGSFFNILAKTDAAFLITGRNCGTLVAALSTWQIVFPKLNWSSRAVPICPIVVKYWKLPWTNLDEQTKWAGRSKNRQNAIQEMGWAMRALLWRPSNSLKREGIINIDPGRRNPWWRGGGGSVCFIFTFTFDQGKWKWKVKVLSQ